MGIALFAALLGASHGLALGASRGVSRVAPAGSLRSCAGQAVPRVAPVRVSVAMAGVQIVDEVVELAQNNYVNKATRMLQAMEKQRVQLQGIPRAEARRAYLAVWEACDRTSRYAIILNLYQRFVGEPGLVDLNATIYDTVLYACERQADGVLGESIMRTAGENAERYNRVIRARTKQLEITDAVRLYRELQQKGWKLETSTINLMMQVCFAIKQIDYSLRLFTAIDALGIEADERTFTIAIRSAAALVSINAPAKGGPRASTDIGKGWVLCLRLLNAMRSKEQAQGMPRIKGGLPIVPSSYCFTTVIKCLASSGEAEKAESVLGQMVKAGCVADAGLYAIVMRACAQRGRIDDAFRLLDQMKERKIAPEIAHIAALLLACERRGDPQRSIEILDSMPTFNLKPTTLTYNMAMSACAKRGELPLVEKLLAKMDLESDEAKPDIVSLNTVLDAYKRAEKWEACLEFLLKMENERRIKPDVVSVNTAIKACKDNSQYEIALQLFDGMGARGLVPDSVSFTEIIASCGKAGDWARALCVFDTAKGKNVYIWNAIVGAAVACDETDQALIYLKMMRNAGFTPDIVTFTTVMTMCSKREEWEAVLFLATELEQTGLMLSKPLLNQVQRASQALSGKEGREAIV